MIKLFVNNKYHGQIIPGVRWGGGHGAPAGDGGGLHAQDAGPLYGVPGDREHSAHPWAHVFVES